MINAEDAQRITYSTICNESDNIREFLIWVEKTAKRGKFFEDYYPVKLFSLEEETAIKLLGYNINRNHSFEEGEFKVKGYLVSWTYPDSKAKGLYISGCPVNWRPTQE